MVMESVQMNVRGKVTPTGAQHVPDSPFHLSSVGPSEALQRLGLPREVGELRAEQGDGVPPAEAAVGQPGLGTSRGRPSFYPPPSPPAPRPPRRGPAQQVHHPCGSRRAAGTQAQGVVEGTRPGATRGSRGGWGPAPHYIRTNLDAPRRPALSAGRGDGDEGFPFPRRP